MKLKFLSKTLPAFGLHVSDSCFKIVQIERSHSDFAIKGYHSTTLPKGMIVDGAIADLKTFKYMLKTALDQPQYGKFDTNYVVASLPESKSFVRVIQIPQMSMAEAANAIPFEAESFIPLPIDQVYLDWQKIGDTGEKMSILIIASPKEFADKYLEILDKTNLQTLALEVESQSCFRALAEAAGKENVLLVNIGSLRTRMVMVEEGNLQFTSTIPIAGSAFTDSIARALGVSAAKAEEIKKKVGISNTAEYPNITTALLPVLNTLSEEIKNILKFHGEHSEKQVSKVLLLGGSGGLKNLAEFLAPQLQEAGVNSVELVNLWQGLPQFKNPPLDALASLGYVTAIGLAMRGVDFEV